MDYHLGGAGEEYRWLFTLARLVELSIVVGFFVIWAISMSRALNACSRSNRRMEPGLAWLLLIPFFGFIWQFIAVKQTSESLAQEYFQRGWQSDEGRPGIEIGMVTCGVILIAVIVRILVPDLNPGIAFFMTLGVCVCIFMHRDRLNAFTERLEKSNSETPMFFVFEQFNNPFAAQQRQAQTQHASPSAKAPEQPGDAEYSAPGWDGYSTWLPPKGFQAPDMSDPRAWFS